MPLQLLKKLLHIHSAHNAKNRKIIFLDFDGVLHPGFDNTFSQLPKFERLLRSVPDIEVVISSSWREGRAFQELKNIFNYKLQHRIIGITPSISLSNRQIEIEHYCQEHLIFNYLILDDSEELFSRNCKGLYLINHETGLTDEDIKFIKRWFKHRSSD
ncbi:MULTISPECIES: HAD domain-containing protein [Deefgea]|uniref:Uncharacterized protein n=1 Tax=Deefgea chitinilytica TaxID=570276 RepID=A0ABS2CEL1_9NEIS|nr:MULTISPECIES: HAD domain-containing protein [Deefgea]MBM5572502.1 hypothetical protein [Deefgea chitinilytica]MBM9889738.1 hypothetical protein [Deefgea sp. CFH1-16]